MALASSSSSSSASSSSWFQKLQEQFLSGAFTDCIIRVNIVDDADEADEASGAKRQKLGEDHHSKEKKNKKMEEIAAHANILSLRSPYFEKALTSGWKEGEKKTIEISLGSAAAVEDLSLLLRLSYTESYIKDGDRVLDIPTRMRLAELADALEFRDCVLECLLSLGEGLTLETALMVLDEVPEPLVLSYEDVVKELQRKVIKALAGGINEINKKFELNKIVFGDPPAKEKALMQQAEELLMTLLGPAEGFFEERTSSEIPAFPDELTLKPHIKALPTGVMEALLKSDHLQLKSENDAFYLMWAYVKSNDKRYHLGRYLDSRGVFLHLLPHLRFHHMSLDYLANVVVQCPYLKATEKLAEIMVLALIHRDAYPSLLAKRGQGDVLPKNRAAVPLEEARWTLNFTLNLKDLLKLKRDQCKRMYLGLVNGYPIAVYPKWETEERGGGFGLYVAAHLAPAAAFPQQVHGLKRVATMEIECVLDSKNMGCTFLCEEYIGRGYNDCFPGEKWEEIVFEGSPYFRGDVMKGEARIKVLTKSSK